MASISKISLSFSGCLLNWDISFANNQGAIQIFSTGGTTPLRSKTIVLGEDVNVR